MSWLEKENEEYGFLPNEMHASDDDWDDYESVNDPASGKKLPNEGHASEQNYQQGFDGALADERLKQPIYITESFKKDIHDIYGQFTPRDDEYPSMGITIQGSPVFVECVRFPDVAVIRRRSTDEVKREHPAVGELWKKKLNTYKGKCRTSTVHIHPMNFPSLSSTDVNNFESLRNNPNDASTYPTGHPYPVILINLTANRSIEILGFWVYNKTAHQVEVNRLEDQDSFIVKAWDNALEMPFFSEEGNIASRINKILKDDWNVTLGVNERTGEKAIKAQHIDGSKVLVKFDSQNPLGLSLKNKPEGFFFENYVNWQRMFNDIARSKREQEYDLTVNDRLDTRPNQGFSRIG